MAQQSGNPFAGRWDITITTPNSTYPGWMEVTGDANTLQVRVQPRSGSVYPVKEAKIEGGKLLVPVSRAQANRPAMSWEFTAQGDRLSGELKRAGTAAGQLCAMRAPALNRKPPKAWTKPEPLFDGKDLTGWEPDNPSANHWVAKDGVLLNESKGANLKSTRKFDDFKLHIEFNCPDRGNSGIYLRGRYEVQVEYEPSEDNFHRMGSIYGMVPVSADLPRKPGQWESFDITLVGRDVTILRNGVKVIDNQEIAGITGGALDSHEGEPGPFYFQGDHTGGMMYRNITISLPRK